MTPPHSVPRSSTTAKKANPGPLGLFAFGLTTLMLMYIEAEWAAPGFAEVVACTALFFGGVVQLLAGMWEMHRGSTFAATAFSSYGAFWMGFAALRVLKLVGFTWGADAAGYAQAEALYLGTWGMLSVLFFALTFAKCVALRATFALLVATFFLLAGGQFDHGARMVGGYVGLACAACAVYTGFGEMVLETYDVRLPGL
ncbi:GPR1/FUN34/yaaH family-domain-containing protein [Tribonema minus]|uniref:GPR1/FUN34/yaaH family-domain-containing protein n=1 Tax=Tribonema minus TaxID=303371 RepID=A0A835ZDY7_9STRA|nr:GPR1/FUN34/yaaH family-domain-containing protein [Tribonema minus]